MKIRSLFLLLLFLLAGCTFLTASGSADAAGSRAGTMAAVLEKTEVFPADAVAIARRFGRINTDPLPVPEHPVWQLGMERAFWVIHSGLQQTLQAEAVLVYLGENVACWVEKESADRLPDGFFSELEQFDQEIYPFLRRIFGSEMSPGVDNDPLIHVLFSGKAGAGILGYFSSRDAESTEVSPFSNEMDLFILNTVLLEGDIRHITNTLSHEYQHMIHFAHDRNETSVVDEGLSGLAEYLIDNRINTTYERNYLSDPDRSMTNWPVTESSTPYYGGSFLFFKYLSDRLGPDFLREIILRPENGLDGVDAALRQFASNNEGLTADTLYLEWITANLLAAIGQPDGKYRYQDYSLPEDGEHLLIQSLPCEDGSVNAETMQYGVDYYRLDCPDGQYEIRLTGEPFVPVIGRDAIAGNYSWWTNAVTNSETSLVRAFDLSEIKDGPITLSYEIAYEIEPGFDFLYLSWSTDDGRHWQNLRTGNGTDQNESGFNLGWGYTGSSNGILHETVDLSAFAGEQLMLRFDYLTDQALVQDGALIDNIQIDAIGFRDDAETDDAGWEASGFVRLYNSVPQNFALTRVRSDGTASEIVFASWERGDGAVFLCDFDDGTEIVRECLWGISAINRYSRESGSYAIEVLRIQ